jgi:hypothetical protein
MKFERFEDIRAWQQARELANLDYDLTEKGNFSRDFRLRDQIQGAAGRVHNSAAIHDGLMLNSFTLKYARRVPASSIRNIWH